MTRRLERARGARTATVAAHATGADLDLVVEWCEPARR